MIDYDGLQKHQQQTYDEIIEMLKIYDRVLCVRPTGYGKTKVLIKRLYDNLEGRKLIVTCSSHLRNELTGLGYNCKTYAKVHSESKNEVNFLNEYKNSDIKYIFADEVHRAGAMCWNHALEALIEATNAKLIGFTATPIRPSDYIDVTELLFDNIQVKPLFLNESIELNFSKKPKYIKAFYNVNVIEEEIEKIRKFHASGVDLKRFKLENIYNIDKIIKKHYNIEMNGNKILVFCSYVSQLEDTANYFYKIFKSIFPEKSIHIYKTSYLDVFNEELNNFVNSNYSDGIHLCFSVNKLNEGFRINNVNTVIFMRPTTSEVIYLQQFGRALNNLEPLIFDFSNNCERIENFKHRNQTDKSIVKHGIRRERAQDLMSSVELIDYSLPVQNLFKKFSGLNVSLSEENMDYIRNNVTEYGIYKVARLIHVPPYKVKDFCDLEKIDYSIRTYSELSEENKSFINDNYKNMYLSELASYTGKSATTIRNYLVRQGKNDYLTKVIDTKKRKEIIELAANHNIQEIANITGFSHSTVASVLKRENVKAVKKFTTIDDKSAELIRLNYMNMTDKELTKIVPYTEKQIAGFRYRNNLGKTTSPKWSKKDYDFIKNNWLNMSDEEMAKCLNRNVSVVKSKRVKILKLYREDSKEKYTEEDDAFIKDNWPKMSYEEIAKHLGRTVNSVSNRRRKYLA